MVNKDQLEQTPEGQQVLALLAKNFTAEQFQPALTLIEQLYTEDQTVWDAEVNRDSKFPFHQTTSAKRLLLFFDNPSDLVRVKNELEQREQQAHIKSEEAPAPKIPAPVEKPKAKAKTPAKTKGVSQKAPNRKVVAAKAVKKKPVVLKRSKPAGKRSKSNSLPSKAQKPQAKKKQKPLAGHSKALRPQAGKLLKKQKKPSAVTAKYAQSTKKK